MVLKFALAGLLICAGIAAPALAQSCGETEAQARADAAALKASLDDYAFLQKMHDGVLLELDFEYVMAEDYGWDEEAEGAVAELDQKLLNYKARLKQGAETARSLDAKLTHSLGLHEAICGKDARRADILTEYGFIGSDPE